MTDTDMDDALGDMFAECLARLDAGATVDECLAAYPQERAALEGPLRLATRLRALPGPAPLPPVARARLTTQVLEQVAAQRASITGSARSPSARPTQRAFDASALLAGILRAMGYRGALSVIWLRVASVAIAVVLVLLLSAGALAAARAVIRVIVPPQPTAAPASTQPTLAPAETFNLDGPITQLAPDGWIVNGMPVALDPQTAISGTPALGAVAHIRGPLQDDGALLARSITVDAAPPLVATPVPAASVPASALEPTAPPVPAQPEPAAPGDAFEQLRALLVAATADGRAGEDGSDLIERLDSAREALAGGDQKKAREQLRELRSKLREKGREAKMDAEFVRQAQALIDVISQAYSLNIPPAQENEDKGNGEDKGKDNGEDKGKDNDEDKGEDKGKGD
jgi:Domain of unknown function (DUF5666)